MASMPVGSSPAKRLVEHQDLGIVDERGRQLDPLLVAVRERLDLARRPIGDVETFQPHPCGLGRVGLAQAVQSTQILNLLADEHGRVEAPLLGHVAEPAPIGLAYGPTVPADFARVEIGQSEDRPHGGRLAGAVGTEKSDDMP